MQYKKDWLCRIVSLALVPEPGSFFVALLPAKAGKNSESGAGWSLTKLDILTAKSVKSAAKAAENSESGACKNRW